MGRLRVPRNSQPQGPVGIDWSNPITKTLVGVVTPFDYGYRVGNAGVAPVAGKRSTSSGVGHIGNGSSYFAKALFGSKTLTKNFTLVGVQNMYHGAASGFGACLGTSTGGNQQALLQNDLSVGTRFYCRAANGGGNNNALSALGTGSEPAAEVWIGQYDQTSTLWGSANRLYRSGVLDVASAPENNLGTPSFDRICIGGVDRGTDFFAGSGGHSTLAGFVFESILSLGEIKSLSDNPWQIFAPIARNIWIPAASVVSISRPTADVTTSGWTGNPDNVTLFNNLDETVASDTDYITSPTITGGENAIFTISPTLAAGTWDVRFRAQFVGSSAQVRITLLDGSNASQGVSSWQTVTSTFALYTASVTTTGSAVRVKIEVQ